MNKDDLRDFLRRYGEVQALKDIGCIWQDLSKEWFNSGNKKLGFIFSDASMSIIDVAHKLESAEKEVSNTTQSAPDNVQLEFDTLLHYFQKLTLREYRDLYTKDKARFFAKIERLGLLKRMLDRNNDTHK